MRKTNDHIQRLFDTGILGFLKLPSVEKSIKIASALYEGGLRVIEFSMVMDDCLQAVVEVKKFLGSSMSVGVGTVLNAKAAQIAINSGADFLVSPFEVKEVLNVSKEKNVPFIPGAMTPGEVFAAYKNGAQIVKLFPGGVLGVNYISALKAPFPYIPLMPDGGVNLNNARELINAGSTALGVGTALTPKEYVESNKYSSISEIAESFISVIREAK